VSLVRHIINLGDDVFLFRPALSAGLPGTTSWISVAAGDVCATVTLRLNCLAKHWSAIRSFEPEGTAVGAGRALMYRRLVTLRSSIGWQKPMF